MFEIRRSVFFGSFVGALSLLGVLCAPATSQAQSGQPVIEVFRIEKVVRDGRRWLEFSWDVRNTDRVHLLQDGRAMESRIQLRDGSFGWPPNMPGGFRIGTDAGNFTLVAQNPLGRVEAKARIEPRGCFAFLTPPGRNWTRCRAGGVIASNLGAGNTTSTAPPRPAPPRPAPPSRQRAGKCDAYGEVTSRVGFRLRVPRRYNNPSAGYDTFTLNEVYLRRDGTSRVRTARLSGRGSSRSYSFQGLTQGVDYVVGLGGGWWSRPGEIRFRCPSSRASKVRRHLPGLQAQGVRTD